MKSSIINSLPLRKKIILFFSFFLISLISFSQKGIETIPLDTSSITYEVVYQPTLIKGIFSKKTGVFTHDTSAVAVEINYSKNIQNGLYKVYFPSGKLMVLTIFANGKINGDYTWYDKTGKINVKGRYQNGIKHGYWAYKAIRTYGRYKKGVKNKKWIRYDENEKKHKSYYKNGKLKKGEGVGNDTTIPTTTKDTTIVQNKPVEEIETHPDEKEYQQAITFLKENFVLKKAIKEHFCNSIKEFRQFKKHYRNGVFQFAISPSLIPLGISTFIKESEEERIIVPKIDSILKTEPKNLKRLFNSDGKEIEIIEDNHFDDYSTDKLSPIVVYFSPIQQNLLRIDVMKYDNSVEKTDIL